MRGSLLSILLLLSTALFSAVDTKRFAGPWFTGPLLSPNAEVTPLGTYQIQPYLFWLVYNGHYDAHWHLHNTPNFYQTTLLLPLWVGIQENADINISFQAQYNRTQGVSSEGSPQVE